MFDWATTAYDKSVSYTKEKWNEMITKFDNAKKKLVELQNTQKLVDAKIASLPNGLQKTALIIKRDESRSYFQKWVIPAWEKISSYFGDKEKQMSAIPLLAIGGTVAISAALTAFTAYTVTSYNKEMAILKDPLLSASQKTQMITTASFTGGMSQATDNINKMLMTVGALGLAYIGFRVAKKKQII